MSKHSNDSFESAYYAVSLECPACTCKPQSLHCSSSSSSGHEETVDAVVLAACFDIWRIPLWRSNRVVWSPCRRGGQWCGTSLRCMLVHICDAFHDPQGVRLGSGQMSCGMEEWAEHNGCRSDPGRWTKQLRNRDFFFPRRFHFKYHLPLILFPKRAECPGKGKLWCPPKHFFII